MSVDTIRAQFTLERVGKPAAIFDLEKLQWMNGVYIRQMEPEVLASQLLPFLQRDLPDHLLPVDQDYLLRLVPLIQERLKTLSDAPDMLSYFFEQDPDYEAAMLIQRNMDADGTLAALRRAVADLAAVATDQFRSEYLEELLRASAGELGLNGRQYFGTLRVAMSGRNATPPLFEMMDVMGKERVLHRLSLAANKLDA
jgi:glutamyl-tRNA synthetase